jgi:hypothetical protein
LLGTLQLRGQRLPVQNQSQPVVVIVIVSAVVLVLDVVVIIAVTGQRVPWKKKHCVHPAVTSWCSCHDGCGSRRSKTPISKEEDHTQSKKRLSCLMGFVCCDFATTAQSNQAAA